MTTPFDALEASRKLVYVGMQPAHAEVVADQLLATAASRAREPAPVT